MSFLNFSNVRYAAAPTGHARFAPPSSPEPTPGIQNGQTAVICPQAEAEWIDVDFEFLSGLPLTGGPVPNYTEADIPPTDPRTSEDCLFLDVLVPEDTFQKGAKAKAAVLVFIHGGGYLEGHKVDGLGLVTTSKANGGPGIVYVSINYRLGLFVSP
jgi:cholinesterase